VTGLATSGKSAAGVIPAGKVMTARWACGFAARSSLRSRRPSGPQPQYNILHYMTEPDTRLRLPAGPAHGTQRGARARGRGAGGGGDEVLVWFRWQWRK
jgi:hypothetical protein